MCAESSEHRSIQERYNINLSHFAAIRESDPSCGKLLVVLHATFVGGAAYVTRDTPYLGGAVLAAVTIAIATLILYAKSHRRNRDKEKPLESGP